MHERYESRIKPVQTQSLHLYAQILQDKARHYQAVMCHVLDTRPAALKREEESIDKEMDHLSEFAFQLQKTLLKFPFVKDPTV